MLKDKPIIFLVGPTAAGKTRAAVALARKINAQIISCDSMQVYRGMDIITSKPPKALLKKVPHHLVSTILAQKEYDVFRYRREALRRVKAIIKKGKLPLFVGGTGLYMSILLDGIFQAPIIGKQIRRQLLKEAEKHGSAYLHEKLKKIDPVAAGKMHPHDTKRIIRALEVFRATGKPISRLQKQRKGIASEYNVRIFCLNLPRQELYRRINARVDEMFKQGLVKEVKKLLQVKLSRTAQYAIGLKELKGYFDGVHSLEEARQLIKRNTRRYAKRQLTWFRKDKRIEWLDVERNDTAQRIAMRLWEKLY